MVLFVSYPGAFGGAERLMLEFAAAFEQDCALACPADGTLAIEARARGIRVFPISERTIRLRGSAGDRWRALIALAGHGREIRRLTRTLRPHVVIAWGMRSAIAATIGPRPDCPVVFQHNDLLPGPLIGRVVRAAAARAELTLTLSHAIADDLDPDRTLGGRLKVVHPGIDVARFSGSVPPPGPPIVLVLGAIARWKRSGLAVQACALARRQHRDLRLRIVGAPLDADGSAVLDELRAQASGLDWVELPGAVADPAGELERAFCLLHCAEREPFGMAVLEAIAAGRPAVVPSAAGPAEIVDYSCGLLYEPADEHAAAAALVQLLSEPERARSLGAAGRQRARQHFDLGRARSRYAAAVKPLLRTTPQVRA